MICRISSGDFEIIIMNETLLGAVDQAIQLHDKFKYSSNLGPMIVAEEIDANSNLIGEPFFLPTKPVIERNTDGFGTNNGQYKFIGSIKDISQ